MSKAPYRTSRNAARDARIQAEVGAPLDSCSAWFAYVGRSTTFPFAATYAVSSSRGALSPGSIVQVIGLSQGQPDAPCLLAKVISGHNSITLPLEHLEPYGVEAQAVLDWHYWCLLPAWRRGEA
jgi:hypothetical protein